MSIPSNTTVSLPDNQAIVALGANLPSPAGAPAATFAAALAEMQKLATEPLRCSSFHASKPEGCAPGTPDFLNAVCVITVREGLTPEQLLEQLLSIEQQFGRVRDSAANASRPLDLDLICFGRRRLHTPTLTLPHPRAARRGFVLQPLAELLPALRLPGQTVSVQVLLSQIASD